MESTLTGIDPKAAEVIKESAAEFSKANIINSIVAVKTAADLNIAIEFLSGLKAYYKAKEDKRKEIVDPIKKSVKLIDAEFKKITDKILSAIDLQNGEIMKYRAKEAARIAAENAKTLAKIAAEQAKVDAAFKKEMKGTRGDERIILQAQKESAVAAVAETKTIKTQETSIAGTSFRKIVDNDKIRSAIASTNGKIVIPGIRAIIVWDFEILDAKAIPEEYKKEISATRL